MASFTDTCALLENCRTDDSIRELSIRWLAICLVVETNRYTSKNARAYTTFLAATANWMFHSEVSLFDPTSGNYLEDIEYAYSLVEKLKLD